MGNRNNSQRSEQGIQLISNVIALWGKEEREKHADNIKNTPNSGVLVPCSKKMLVENPKGRITNTQGFL